MSIINIYDQWRICTEQGNERCYTINIKHFITIIDKIIIHFIFSREPQSTAYLFITVDGEVFTTFTKDEELREKDAGKRDAYIDHEKDISEYKTLLLQILDSKTKNIRYTLVFDEMFRLTLSRKN